MQNQKLIFEKNKPGLKTDRFPEAGVPLQAVLPSGLLRSEVALPDVPEVEVIRHYMDLARKNIGVDNTHLAAVL